MSDAFAGVGTKFKRSPDDSSASSFTPIAEVNSITGPDMSRGQIDVTSLDSTGGYREFKAGFRDGGTVTLDMNFTRDTYDDMKLDFEDDELKYYQIVFPDAAETTLDFAGLVTGLSTAVPMDDKVTASVTIKISGQVDLTS